MAFIDAFKRLISPYDDSEDFVDEAAAMEPPQRTQVRPNVMSSSQTEYGAGQARQGQRQQNPFQQGQRAQAQYHQGQYAQGAAPQGPQGQYQQPQQTPQQPRASARPKEGRVVNMGANGKTQMVLMQPKNFTSSQEAMEHLRNRRAVVINMDKTEKDAVVPLLYFLSGFTYAINGNVRQVSANTYVMTPPSVNVMGDELDQMETSGAGL